MECWSTARKKFWKNEIEVNPGAYSPHNLKTMKEGKAPRMTVEVTNRKTGKISVKDYSMELHHKEIPQRVGGDGGHKTENLEVLTPWEHEAVEPFRHVDSDLNEIIKGVDTW